MKQTKPVFLIKRYRSILMAAFVTETVTYLVSLTDTLIAGIFVDKVALSAVGLVAPITLAAVAVGSVINTGTIIHYSQSIGDFKKEHANAFFSQGVLLAIAAGMIFGILMHAAKEPFIAWLGLSPSLAQDVREYYDIMLWFCVLGPLSCLLDNIVIADGGEKLSAVSNVIQIVSNVALSVVLASKYGVWGIAVASVLCKILFFFIICSWFFSSKNNLRFCWTWNIRDCQQIFNSGIVKASIFAAPAVTMVFVNAFAVSRFSENLLITLTVVEELIDASTVFIGLAMSLQPIVGTLKGEANTKALRLLMQTALVDMLFIGVVFSVLATVFAPFFPKAFGIHDGEIYIQCVDALRIVGATMFCHAALSLFFIYYILIDKGGLSLFICLCKETVCPLVIIFLAVFLLNDESGLWIGFSVGAVVSLLLCALFVLKKYKREQFPFLLPKDDESIYIYYFNLTPKNIVDLSKTASEILASKKYPNEKQMQVGLIIEELMMLVNDKNQNLLQSVNVEFTLILNKGGIKLIFRDSGQIIDYTDGNLMPDSFRQYFISVFMENIKYKTQLTTTGYNRNIIKIPFFD